MGRKVNPYGLRADVIKDWDSKWFAEGDFTDNLVEDYNIRRFLKKRLYASDANDIEIECASGRVRVVIHTAKSGVAIGKQGAEIKKLKKGVAEFTEEEVFTDIKEIKRSGKEAQLVAESITRQLENKTSFRHTMKSIMRRSMESGILGTKTCCVGRLGGMDIARSEFCSEGITPLQTLHTDIGYGFVEANTTYDKVDAKVWIYKGEVLPARTETGEGNVK